MNYVLFAAALAPSFVLIGLALWFAKTRPERDDFLERRDDWGAL